MCARSLIPESPNTWLMAQQHCTHTQSCLPACHPAALPEGWALWSAQERVLLPAAKLCREERCFSLISQEERDIRAARASFSSSCCQIPSCQIKPSHQALMERSEDCTGRGRPHTHLAAYALFPAHSSGGKRRRSLSRRDITRVIMG